MAELLKYETGAIIVIADRLLVDSTTTGLLCDSVVDVTANVPETGDTSCVGRISEDAVVSTDRILESCVVGPTEVSGPGGEFVDSSKFWETWLCNLAVDTRCSVVKGSELSGEDSDALAVSEITGAMLSDS